MGQQGTLKRSLGFWAIVAFGVGDILGAGIYALIGKIAGIAGAHSWLSFLVALIVAGFTAFSYAELSGRIPRSAGEAAFAEEGFRKPWLSLLVGWLVLCSGIVSMATALDHPDRVAGLVLIGTASQCTEKVAGWYEQIALAGERDGTVGLAHTIYGEKSKRRITGDAQGIAHVTRMLKSLYDDPLTPKLEAIGCPVLLIVGENDPMGPRASSIIGDQLPNAELRAIPDCGHWVHVEQPEAVLEALDPWLERLTA